MRFVSHWPLGVQLLFLAYLPKRTNKPPRIWRFDRWNGRPRTMLYLFDHFWPLPFSSGGTRPAGGWRRLSAYTRKKVLGMRSVTYTAVRHTAAACSSWWRRGRVSGVWSRRSMGLRRRALVNSYSGHGLSIDATATPGASGERRELAAYGEAA